MSLTRSLSNPQILVCHIKQSETPQLGSWDKLGGFNMCSCSINWSIETGNLFGTFRAHAVSAKWSRDILARLLVMLVNIGDKINYK